MPGGPAHVEGLNEESLLNLVETLFRWDDGENFETFYDAALRWPRLRVRFSFIFDGVALDSPEAQQLRRNLELSRELAERPEPLVDPPPEQRISVLLDRFENGDWNAWWQLNRELTLTPQVGCTYLTSMACILSMPGWLAADEPTKQRILNAAEHYLSVGETSISEWIGTNQFRLNDLAAFRALILLEGGRKVDL